MNTSKVKSFVKQPIKSKKPFSTSITESLLVSTISVLFFILTIFIVAYINDDYSRFTNKDFKKEIIVNFLIIGTIQYLGLEYSGITKMSCETSMRYYDDTWKEKYKAKKEYKQNVKLYGEQDIRTINSFKKYNDIKNKIKNMI